MTFNDKIKIMDGLKHCLAENCDGCPYRPEAHEDYIVCSKQPMLDALEILEEQGTKWIHREDLDYKDKLGCNHFHGMCGNCGFIHDFIDYHTGQYKYCPQCGKVVKLE